MNTGRTRPSLEPLEERLAPTAEGDALAALIDPARVSYEAVADRSGLASEVFGASDPGDEEAYYLSWVPADYRPHVMPGAERQTFIDFGRRVLPPYDPPAGLQDGDDVWIPSGITITWDLADSPRLGIVRNDGVFRADPAGDAEITCNLFANWLTGRVEVGAAASPVTGAFDFLFTPYLLDPANDPTQLGGGFVSVGAVDVHGAPVPTWGPAGSLGVPAIPTLHGYEYTDARTVTFRDEGDLAADSAHVLLMHPDSRISYAAFVGLGRTLKTSPLGPDNRAGRYALHVHRTGVTSVAVTIDGVVVLDPTSWGIVVHSSLAHVTNSVVWGATGAAFMAEAADGAGSFVNNFAYQVTGDDRHIEGGRDVGDVATRGHGFWIDPAGFSAENNRVEDAKDSAYVSFAFNYPENDTGQPAPGAPAGGYAARTLRGPFLDNQVHGARVALDVFYAEHPGNRWERLTATGLREFGITGRFTADQTHVGHDVTGTGGPQAETGFPLGAYGFGTSVIDSSFRGFREGVVASHDGPVTITGGDYSGNTRAGVVVQAPVSNPAPLPPNVITVTGITGTVMIDPVWFAAGNFAWYAYHKDWQVWHDGVRLYHPLQYPDAVPFADAQYGPLAGLTNRQIYETWGLAPYGAIPGVVEGVEPAQVAFDMPEPLGLHALAYYYRGVRYTTELDVQPGWQVAPVEPEPGVRTALFLKGA